MKRMKSFILKMNAILMVSLVCLCLVSCGGDDDDNVDSSANIYGTWRSEFSDGYQLLTFGKDGNYSLVEIDNTKGNWSETGIYSLSGSILIIGDEKYRVDKLTSTQLIITYTHYRENGVWIEDESGDSDDNLSVWTRVSD